MFVALCPSKQAHCDFHQVCCSTSRRNLFLESTGSWSASLIKKLHTPSPHNQFHFLVSFLGWHAHFDVTVHLNGMEQRVEHWHDHWASGRAVCDFQEHLLYIFISFVAIFMLEINLWSKRVWEWGCALFWFVSVCPASIQTYQPIKPPTRQVNTIWT